jgi:hypothetical protein
MINMKKVITVIIVPILLFNLAGCKNRSVVKEQKHAENQEIKAIENKIESNVYPLPTSAEVIKMLTDLEVGYQFGITNPIENSKKYFSSAARATNMGIYGADLSYTTIYNQSQEVINYLNAIRDLANELNMSKIYDESLYDRIKMNFDKRDTLVKILTGSFNDTYNYLADNEQQPLALLVVGGAWVEGMYLTTHVSAAAYNVAGIAKNLIEQKKSFELFLELTKPYETDATVSEFVTTLAPIKKVYDTLGTSLTEQNIKDITKAMEEVRNRLIQ